VKFAASTLTFMLTIYVIEIVVFARRNAEISFLPKCQAGSVVSSAVKKSKTE